MYQKYQSINIPNHVNKENKEAIDILVKEIVKAIKENTVNCDRTYRTVIKSINKKGYVILDLTGSERTVQCCIPGVELIVGQSVWVKEPMGKLNEIHICGVVGNTSNSGRRNRRI